MDVIKEQGSRWKASWKYRVEPSYHRGVVKGGKGEASLLTLAKSSFPIRGWTIVQRPVSLPARWGREKNNTALTQKNRGYWSTYLHHRMRFIWIPSCSNKTTVLPLPCRPSIIRFGFLGNAQHLSRLSGRRNFPTQDSDKIGSPFYLFSIALI